MDADDSEPCLYRLTDRDVQLILAQVDTIAWKTRYLNPDNTFPDVDQSVIDAWKGALTEHVMTCQDEDAPAPYWDDADAQDADDQELVTTEDWYGGVTYTESGVPVFAGNRLEDWLIAGFIAIVAGKDKAVRFLTLAKQFNLYLRTGDYGGAVNVFLNGILVLLVDTYSTSPGLKTVSVITDGVPALGMGAEDAYVELLIVQGDHHDGISTPQLQIVRKRLWAGEVSPQNTRYNSECDCVEVTYDDGTTWHERPAADPRHSDIYRMPPIDDRCAAAAGMVELVRRAIDSLIADLEIVQIANAFLDILLVLSGGAGILIDLILVVVEALLAIGSATISGAFDETAYAGLLCCFYCNIESDGSMTASDLADTETQIGADLDTTVYDVMQILFSLWGEVLVNNGGVEFADTGADCSGCDCGWCLTVDFTDNNGGFAVYGAGQGAWTSGIGWQATNVTLGGVDRTLVQIVLALGAETQLTEIGLFYSWAAGSQTSGIQAKYLFTNNFTYPNGIDMVTDDVTDTTLIWELAQTRNEIDVLLQCSHSGFGGSATAKSMTLRGFGDPPALSGWISC